MGQKRKAPTTVSAITHAGLQIRFKKMKAERDKAVELRLDIEVAAGKQSVRLDVVREQLERAEHRVDELSRGVVLADDFIRLGHRNEPAATVILERMSEHLVSRLEPRKTDGADRAPAIKLFSDEKSK